MSLALWSRAHGPTFSRALLNISPPTPAQPTHATSFKAAQGSSKIDSWSGCRVGEPIFSRPGGDDALLLSTEHSSWNRNRVGFGKPVRQLQRSPSRLTCHSRERHPSRRARTLVRRLLQRRQLNGRARWHHTNPQPPRQLCQYLERDAITYPGKANLTGWAVSGLATAQRCRGAATPP